MKNSILEKLTVGIFGCNCYLIGSGIKKEIYIIDPGAEPNLILDKISQLNAKPIGIILTHAHPDHTGCLKVLQQKFHIPIFYNQKEYKHPILMKADRWLNEGDILAVGKINLNILETGGHTPGGISLYSKDIELFRGKKYDGIIFTGDLIFRRSVGRTDLHRGNKEHLFENISKKIIYNPQLTDNFLILAGHLGLTTIKEEKTLNPFGNLFLKPEDWKKNKYYDKDLKDILKTSIEERP
ncbi:MAG: MBL fold metallo-hydrolase [Promethearchaeota archaeon]|nr:MAG: MBL fold metallo-hydrolase [Candidatus Lokiarchaeota archaeon]